MKPKPHPRVLALLDEAKDHPDDDGPRLVLADWLQENGRTESERALGEFIFVQCQLAGASPDPGLGQLPIRERQLRAEYGGDWLGAWETRTKGWSWERGLLRLRLRDLGWLRAPQGKPAHFLWVDGLGLHLGSGDVGERALGELARSPVLGQLNRLDLDYSGLGPSGLEVLLGSPHLGRLTELFLGQTGVGSEGARLLAASPSLSRLTTLSLWGSRIDDDGARALADSPHLGNLTRLDLRNNPADFSIRTRHALRARFGAGVLL